MTPILTDRTTAETDEKCPQMRGWYKDYLGTGIVPAVEQAALKEGSEFHSDFARLTMREKINLPNPGDLATDPEREVACRRLGVAHAFATYILPMMWQAGYDPVMVEKELVLVRKNLWVATTADVVWRDPHGSLVSDDYKSVGMLTRGWSVHWTYAIQLHVQMAAVQDELKEPVARSHIRGIDKGFVKDGKLRHPYVWAYSDGDAVWQAGWKSGLTLRGVWEYPAGVQAWVESLGRDVAMSLFPTSAPVIPDERLLDRWVDQRIARELQIMAHTGGVDDPIVYPRHFQNCRPVIGFECPYLSACHSASVEDDPIASGLYVPRTPHHDLEFISKLGENRE